MVITTSPSEFFLYEIDQELNRLEDNKESQLLKERLSKKRIFVVNSLVAAESSFPQNWDKVYANFSSLVNTENKARLMYRRQADKSYGSIKDIVDIVEVARCVAGVVAVEG